MNKLRGMADTLFIPLEAQIPDDNIRKHGPCNILYLGTGLETAYYRLGEKTAVFYEVDLPQVIDARRAVLGESINPAANGQNHP